MPGPRTTAPVCKDCSSANGVKCPTAKPVCCAGSGACVANQTDCAGKINGTDVAKYQAHHVRPASARAALPGKPARGCRAACEGSFSSVGRSFSVGPACWPCFAGAVLRPRPRLHPTQAFFWDGYANSTWPMDDAMFDTDSINKPGDPGSQAPHARPRMRGRRGRRPGAAGRPAWLRPRASRRPLLPGGVASDADQQTPLSIVPDLSGFKDFRLYVEAPTNDDDCGYRADGFVGPEPTLNPSGVGRSQKSLSSHTPMRTHFPGSGFGNYAGTLKGMHECTSRTVGEPLSWRARA
jgi:hypothetical protein